MIPDFDGDGKLPPGIHYGTWSEIVTRFGTTLHRQRLLSGLAKALQCLTRAGCRRIFLDGSFVTTKEHPNDYDVCYDVSGVDPAVLPSEFIDFSDFRKTRAEQKAKYYGEFLPAHFRERGSGTTFLEFFQMDRETGREKGIIALDIGEGEYD